MSYTTTFLMAIVILCISSGQLPARSIELVPGSPVPDGVTLTIGDEKTEMPEAIYQNAPDGPIGFTINTPLARGFYSLSFTYKNIRGKASTIEILVDGKPQSYFETFRFDPEGFERTYTYTVYADDFGDPACQKPIDSHEIYVGIGQVTDRYRPAYIPRLEIVSVNIEPYDPVVRDNGIPNRPYCDLWGWLAAIEYQREEPASLEYMIEKTVMEPKLWGSNFLQTYPYLHMRHWTGELTPEEIDEFTSRAHDEGFLIDEHAGSNPNDTWRCIKHIHEWGKLDSNILIKGFDNIADTWEAEAIGHAIGKAPRDEVLTDCIKMMDGLWVFNPGTPFNQCDQRPNVWQGGGHCWDMYDIYKGPNCVKTVMCANGWVINSGQSHIPWVSYTDMNPMRVFPENLGMNNGNRDLFIGYQADSRLKSFAPPGKVGAIFGGATCPDQVLRQADDMFRPRAIAPDDVHESAIWWLGETPPVWPETIRDAVYAASMDPIRHAFTARLSSSATDGHQHSKLRIFAETYGWDNASTCPWYTKPNEYHPFTTAFVQNNRMRMLRYASRDFGVLQIDPEQLAHFDSNSLAVDAIVFDNDAKIVQQPAMYSLTPGWTDAEAGVDEIDLATDKVIPRYMSSNGLRLAKLMLNAPESNCVVRFSATAMEEDAELKLFRDSYMMKHSDTWGGYTFKQGLVEKFDIPLGETKSFEVPCDFVYSGDHIIELEVIKGRVQMGSFEILPPPVDHRWLARGGNRAVLKEMVACEDGEETRTYITDNNSSHFIVKVERESLSERPFAMTARLYDNCKVEEQNGISQVTLRDSKAVLPELDMVTNATVTTKEVDNGTHISVTSESSSFDIVFVSSPESVSDSSVVASSALSSLSESYSFTGDTLEIGAKESCGPTTVIAIDDDHDGRYYINENDWWFERGAQPCKEQPGKKYLKICETPGKKTVIKKSDYIHDTVRAGWGSQYMMSISDINSSKMETSCTARVHSMTAYIFAPRLDFAVPFDTVLVDGKPWPYHDSRFVFLPTEPGDYKVEVRETGKLTPRMICASGMLKSGSWNESTGELNLHVAYQPWTQNAPEGQDYFALIKHEGRILDDIEGAVVAPLNDLGLSDEEIDKMRETGFAIRFKPATPDEPEKGRIKMTFK